MQKNLLALVSAIVFFSCTSNEIANSKDVNQDKIYQGYDVNYTEGDAAASVTSTFRFGGSNGTTLVLSNPSVITLDGSKQNVDSSWGGGAFYKFTIPAQKMYGNHELVFTTTEEKKFANTFSIQNFNYVNPPKEADRKTALVVQFQSPDLGPEDYIQVNSANTDSSFFATSSGNLKMITIPEKELLRQKKNEVTLEAALYQKAALKNVTSDGGALHITQHLKPITIKLPAIKQ